MTFRRGGYADVGHNIANCITNLQNFVMNNAFDVTFQVSLFAKERMRKINFTAVLKSSKGRNVDALPPVSMLFFKIVGTNFIEFGIMDLHRIMLVEFNFSSQQSNINCG